MKKNASSLLSKKRTDTLNYRPSKFFLYYSVLLFRRENPFFFHLFHRLKDDDEKKKRREKEREREREGHTRLGREGRLRARDDDDDDDDDEGRER